MWEQIHSLSLTPLTPAQAGVYLPSIGFNLTHLANLTEHPYIHDMFYTYICTNKLRGILYTGHTDDLSARMEQHSQKIFDGFTAKYNCDQLVWFEKHPTRNAAFKRERQIKKWKRGWKLNLIEKENPYWLDIHTLPIWPPIDGPLPTQGRAGVGE